MELTDIVQITSLSALFFFLLGYTVRPRLQRGLKALQNYFLKPRYLKSAGFLSGDNYSSKAKKK